MKYGYSGNEVLKMSMLKDIEELQKKAGAYEILKEEHIKLKEGVNNALTALNKLLGDNNGLLAKRKKGNNDATIALLLEDLENGLVMTKKAIFTFASEHGIKNTQYFYKRASKEPNIKISENGALYYQKSASKKDISELAETLPDKFTFMK